LEIESFYKNYHTHIDINPEASENVIKKVYKKIYLKKADIEQSEDSVLVNLIATIVSLYPPRHNEAMYEYLLMPKPDSVNNSILEIGCGSGEFLKRMQSIGWNVAGTDIDTSAIANARRKSLEVFKEQEFKTEKKFDQIVLSHVIEHLPEPRAKLEEIKSLLKKDGILHILTPNGLSYGHEKFKEHWRGLECPRHLNIFSLQSLNILVTDLGAEIIKINTTGRGGGTLLESYLMKKKLLKKSNKYPMRLLIEFFISLSWFISRYNNPRGEEIYCQVRFK